MRVPTPTVVYDGIPNKQEKPLSNELILGNMNTALVVTKPEYNLMLKNIQDRMPALTSMAGYNKTPKTGCSKNP
jgi:hypothetical protein